MKVLSSLKSAKARHRDCKVVRRRGKVFVICKFNPRFKARQRARSAETRGRSIRKPPQGACFVQEAAEERLSFLTFPGLHLAKVTHPSSRPPHPCAYDHADCSRECPGRS